MNWTFALGVVGLVLGPGIARARSPGEERDHAAEVRAIFAVKCAGCHGPDLVKPQGRFGYVMDLRRVADNPEMVIPGRPDESELWILVAHGDMPPSDSPHGPLTAREKAMVREWIAAGAPAVRDVAPTPGVEQPAADRVPPSAGRRTIALLGKFHLLLLHFPIALVLAAGIAEVVVPRAREPSPAVVFCLTLAAVAVVPTVVLGWLHAEGGNGAGSPQLLGLHRWVGTVAGAWVIAAALWARRDARRGERSWLGRGLLMVGMLFVVATAHAGGWLAHGRDFFDW